MPPRPAGHRALAACGLLATLAVLLAAGPAQAKYGFVGKWGSPGSGKGQFAFPYGIDTDAAGDVYIADTDNHRIQKFSANGHFLAKWGRKGSRNGQFNNPSDVATDAAGNVYVVEGFNHRIQKFSPKGRFLAKWGGMGSGNGEFDRPTSIATDADGNVYVADHGNSRIQKLSSDGELLAKWGTSTTGFLAGIATDAEGSVYVLDGDWVKKFTANGRFLAKWGGRGSRNGQFNNPTGVTTDAAANVYVIDARNGRIQKFRAVKGSGGKRTVTTIPVRGGRAFFEVSCTLSMPCRAMVEIKVGKQTLAEGRYSVGAGRTRRVSLRLTRAGRKALRRKGRVRAKATIADSRTGKRKTIPVVLRKR
jgi:sugar lactone lactonase YvrE